MRITLALAAVSLWSGCSSSSNKSPTEECTQTLTKRTICSGGTGSCTLPSDAGPGVCEDMAGAPVTVDPVKLSQCVDGVNKGNPDYWSKFFACYLDGKTTNCENDFKNCQGTAVSQLSLRDVDRSFQAACDSYLSRCPSTGSLNDECSGASILWSTATVQAATNCLSQDCQAALDCLNRAL